MVAETFTVAWRRIDELPAGEAVQPERGRLARRVLANHRRGEGRRQARNVALDAEMAGGQGERAAGR